VTSTWPLLWLLAQAAPGPAAPAAPPPAAAAQPAPAPPPPPPPTAQPRVVMVPSNQTPFRLSLNYMRVLHEDGEARIANPPMQTNAIGIDLAFPSNTYVRNHLGLGHQWESAGSYSARGFRIDLVSLGYPIPLVHARQSSFRLDLEPILAVVRGELMFVNGGGRVFRMESGFSLELSAAVRRWFLAVSAGLDFRYAVYTDGAWLTGFARLVPLRVALGHEF
jgi:hypothetical protein